METLLPGILALVIGAAGWFYMFYSRAANRLAAVERPDVNRLRVRLRKLNGLLMLMMAATFYLSFVALAHKRVSEFATLILVVCGLMIAIIVLALYDLRMTSALRRRSKRNQDNQ